MKKLLLTYFEPVEKGIVVVPLNLSGKLEPKAVE